MFKILKSSYFKMFKIEKGSIFKILFKLKSVQK
jgi:hypothetical protein